MDVRAYIVCLGLLSGCSMPHHPASDTENRINHKAFQQQVRQALSNKAALMHSEKTNEVLQNRVLARRYISDYQAASDVLEKKELLGTIAGLDKVNTVSFFISELSNSEPEIRREAAIQLKQMTVNRAVQNALIRALDDKNDSVLIEVIEAVALLDDRRVSEKLRQIAATHADPLIREIARDYAVDGSGELKSVR